MAQHKYREVVSLCESATDGPNRLRNTNLKFLEASLASALSAIGKHEQAIVHADRALANTNDDDKVEFRCDKARILAAAGLYGQAVGVCEETLKEFTRLAQVRQVRMTLSTVYSLQGEYEKSEEQLRLVLETDPDFALANNNLGYQMADRNVNVDEAERLIRRALDLDRRARKEIDDGGGDNAAYLDSLGWVLFRKGKLAEAREWLEKAVALPEGENDPTVWDHLGDVFAKLNESAKAKDAWKKALERYDLSPRSKSDDRRNEVEKKLKTVE
jgi:tetratricopeptide (TPR) repeat protein